MHTSHTIRYVKRADIDTQQWNSCITNASNGLIYGYSFYLDAMAGQWDGLVVNDYDAVMPLPWKKKFNIPYIYQPFLTAQLGLFGNKVDPQLLYACLTAIPSKFRLWEFPLNHGNVFSIEGFELYIRKNFVLSLAKPYDDLYECYRENSKRNIKKSVRYGCVVRREIGTEDIIALAKANQHDTSEEGFERFNLVFNQLKKNGKAKTYGIFSDKDQLLASAIFLFSHNRAYYLLVGNHPNGRTLGASHTLIDAFIKDHSESKLLLDFEGSDIRNLAFFYSGFGATEESYTAIRHNKLPWYAQLLKQ